MYHHSIDNIGINLKQGNYHFEILIRDFDIELNETIINNIIKVFDNIIHNEVTLQDNIELKKLGNDLVNKKNFKNNYDYSILDNMTYKFSVPYIVTLTFKFCSRFIDLDISKLIIADKCVQIHIEDCPSLVSLTQSLTNECCLPNKSLNVKNCCQLTTITEDFFNNFQPSELTLINIFISSLNVNVNIDDVYLASLPLLTNIDILEKCQLQSLVLENLSLTNFGKQYFKNTYDTNLDVTIVNCKGINIGTINTDIDVLTIDNCQLRKCPKLSDNITAYYCQFTNNFLTKVHKSLAKIKNYLNISGNFITDIDVFNNSPLLPLTLDLSRNFISKLKLTKLPKNLILDNNNIVNIDDILKIPDIKISVKNNYCKEPVKPLTNTEIRLQKSLKSLKSSKNSLVKIIDDTDPGYIGNGSDNDINKTKFINKRRKMVTDNTVYVLPSIAKLLKLPEHKFKLTLFGFSNSELNRAYGPFIYDSYQDLYNKIYDKVTGHSTMLLIGNSFDKLDIYNYTDKYGRLSNFLLKINNTIETYENLTPNIASLFSKGYRLNYLPLK